MRSPCKCLAQQRSPELWPTLSCKQVAGLDVEWRPLVARVQKQVQQHQMPIMAREARTVGLSQPDVPQRQSQRTKSCPVVSQLPSTNPSGSFSGAHAVCHRQPGVGLSMKLWHDE